jgi:hypothetical protein
MKVNDKNRLAEMVKKKRRIRTDWQKWMIRFRTDWQKWRRKEKVKNRLTEMAKERSG